MKDPWNALSDSTRREILLLLRKGWLNASRISQNFPFAKSTVSRHLEILEDSGLIISEKRKQYVYYGLNQAAFGPLQDYIRLLENAEVGAIQEIIDPPPAGKAAKATKAAKQEEVPAREMLQQKGLSGETETEEAAPRSSSRKGRVPSYLD